MRKVLWKLWTCLSWVCGVVVLSAACYGVSAGIYRDYINPQVNEGSSCSILCQQIPQ